MENTTDQTKHTPQPRPWSRYAKRTAVILCAAGAALIVAVVVYGVVLFVFEPEDAPGASRVAAFKCLSRAERVYIRQLRGIADERRQHLDSVVEFMEQRGADPRVSQDPQWRWDLSTHMAAFTSSSRAMAQINGPPSARPIQRNLGAMSESATSFARHYLHGVRTNDPDAIAEARTALRDSQRGMLRTRVLGEGLCDPGAPEEQASARIWPVARAPVTRVICAAVYPATSISSVLISGDSSRGAPSVTSTMS